MEATGTNKPPVFSKAVDFSSRDSISLNRRIYSRPYKLMNPFSGLEIQPVLTRWDYYNQSTVITFGSSGSY